MLCVLVLPLLSTPPVASLSVCPSVCPECRLPEPLPGAGALTQHILLHVCVCVCGLLEIIEDFRHNGKSCFHCFFIAWNLLVSLDCDDTEDCKYILECRDIKGICCRRRALLNWLKIIRLVCWKVIYLSTSNWWPKFFLHSFNCATQKRNGKATARWFDWVQWKPSGMNRTYGIRLRRIDLNSIDLNDLELFLVNLFSVATNNVSRYIYELLDDYDITASFSS